MKKLHLLSNAHLDPVWQWRWQEGVGAAITTFSAAADFCEEFENYIFCHNEAILYRWIEENDPALFCRIQKLVAEGKWHIMGGWYLQPDCNMPSGESLIRQIQTGLEYFREKFPTFQKLEVAINFDSFGHTRGLVQILQDAGYRGYVCMRPESADGDRNQIWKGFANSSVIVYRVFAAYNTLLGQVDKKLEPFLARFGDMEEGLFLWGVGNHGGGPSRKDYQIIEELKKKYPQTEIVHSTPEAYWREIEKKRDGFADAGDLNHVNMGCYTSMIRIKQLHQRLENELARAEKMAAHAAMFGAKFDDSAFRRAEEDLMFCEFHDILPGSCIQSAEEDAIVQLSHGIAEAEKIQLKAFFALSGGQPKAESGEYPILVYNPHPFAVRRDVECEFMLADQNWSEEEFHDVSVHCNGEKIPCQLEKESSNLPLDWRKKVVFSIDMQPFSMNRVRVFTQRKPVRPRMLGDISDDLLFDNGELRVRISAKTGLVESIEAGGKQYLEESFSLQVIENYCDPWGFHYDDYQKDLGAFRLLNEQESAAFAAVAKERLSPVRVIEDGEVRTVAESLFGYRSSRAAVRYILPKKGTVVRVQIDLYNNEKDIKLKMRVRTALKDACLKGRTAFGMNVLPQSGGEVVAQDYVVTADAERAVSAIHFGTYGLSARENELNFTLLNSSAYCAHPIDDRVIMMTDRFGARIDQGERHFEFELNFSSAESRWGQIEKESQIAHQQPYAISYFPTGNGKTCGGMIQISEPSVALTACRPSRNKDALLIRLYNSLDRENETDVILVADGARKTVSFLPYQFKSFLIRDGKWIACNCLEEE